MVLDVQSFCRAGAVLGVCDLALNFEGILLGRGLATLTQVFIGTGGRFLSVSHQVHDTARRGSSKFFFFFFTLGGSSKLHTWMYRYSARVRGTGLSSTA